MDSFKKIKGRINEGIQRAKSTPNIEEQQQLIDQTYDLVRSICEVITEMELLKGVVQRYKPNVSMNRIKDINVEGLRPALETIDKIFARACRCIPAHSQPLESLGTRPTLDDLENDWKTLQETRDAYLKG
jgi:hypothetical protein